MLLWKRFNIWKALGWLDRAAQNFRKEAMAYHENLNIIYMRDNGPRRSIRLRRSAFYLLILFFVSLPFLCVLLAVQCWLLWDENRTLTANMERFETEYQKAASRAERLENFEEALLEENVEGRETILRKLAYNEGAAAEEPGAAPAGEEGPGHEEFPAIDTDRVKVSNVQARVMSGNRVRIALDLRNPDNERLLAGEISATLVTARGEEYKLIFAPSDVASFRINRFKRSVMVGRVPSRYNLANAEVIIEVKEDGGGVIFRNIFATHG